MLQKKRKKKKIVFSAIGILAVLILCVGGWYVSAADGNQSSFAPESVHIKSSDIENSTLIIGSHLIYVGSMTDELYEIASDSAAEFSQTNMYYKSELGGGTWYEISSASSIADISTEGTPVANRVIEELSFTHHTKSDGLTYDLVKNKVVNIFDIKDPYDLDEMEELRPLIVQYQLLQEKEKTTEMDDWNIKRLQTFFSEDLKSTKTEMPGIELPGLEIPGLEEPLPEIILESDTIVEEYERGLAGLQNYSSTLQGADEEADKREITTMVMGKLDATRRTYLLAKLYGLLEELSDDVQNSQEELEGDAAIDTAISEAVIESQNNVQTSINKYAANSLTNGTTVIGQEEYYLCTELMNAAEANNADSCGNLVNQLADLYNIRDNIIEKGEAELAYLNSTLVPAGERAYEEILKAGTSEEYQQAVRDGASEVTLEVYLEQSKSNINAVRTEYQFLIKAKTMRMSNAEAQAYMLQVIEDSEEFRTGIPEDAMHDMANETVDQLEQWMKERLAELVNSGEGGTEMSALLKEKEELLVRKQDALDNNDLAEVNRLEALIAAKDQDIAALEQEYSDILNSEDATEGDKAMAAANMQTGTAGATALNIANQTVSDIQNGDFDGLQNALNSLEALMGSNSSAVAGALNSIRDALEASGGTGESGGTGGSGGSGTSGINNEYQDELEQLDSLIEQAEEKSNQNGLTVTEAEDMIQEMMGGSFLSLSEEQQLQAALAVEWYGEIQNNLRMKELAASYADMLLNSNSKYTFPILKTTTLEYVSTKTISECMGYRYVFDDSRMIVTLQKRDAFYEFTAKTCKVRTAEGTTTALSTPAEYQTYIYIPEDYAYDNFGCQVEYMEATGVALLYDETLQSAAEELYNAMLTRGGN